MISIVEITEELMDAMYNNERGFDPMYDLSWDDELPSEVYN